MVIVDANEPRIEIDPNKRFGKAVILGTRVAVDEIVALVATGMTQREVAVEFGVDVEDVLAALRHAARAVANERRWVE